MNILGILQIIAGLIVALFLPGYLIARIFFRELAELEKVALGFVLSIALDIILGLFLGYNRSMKDLTGGITSLNLWIYLLLIIVALLIFWIIKMPEELAFIIKKIKK